MKRRLLITVKKPDVATLWLDSLFAINLVSLSRRPESESSRTKAIFEVAKKLVEEGRLVCPEAGHQADEYGRSERMIRRSFHRISRGVKILPWRSLLAGQILCGLRAYLTKAPDLVIPTSLFFGGAFDTWFHQSGRAKPTLKQIRVSPRPSWERDLLRLGKSQIKTEWDSIAKESNSFETQLQKERLSYHKDVTCLLGTVKTGPATVNDFLFLEDLQRYFRVWTTLGGAAAVEEFVAFFASPYFCSLPAWDIMTTLLADIVTGSGKIKESDAQDAAHLAAVLPVTSYLLTDGAATNRLKKHKLDKQWGVEVFSMRDSDRLVKSLTLLRNSHPQAC